MVTFPNCKINLGLNIIQKREDNYHDLETVFYPIDICDALEIISTTGNTPVQFSTSGFNINDSGDDNLCVKAYKLVKKDFLELPPVKMHLHKAVPVGAGLGGGSANAAFTLLILNKKFQLNLSNAQLINYASQLGSDCAFFIINKPCFAQGKGEQLLPADPGLDAYRFLIVNPGIHISTRWAFTKIQPVIPQTSARQIIQQPVETWKELLTNDFEKPLFQYYPQLKSIKEKLYGIGAVYAGMSGSGSTFFGIFSKDKKVDTNSFPSEYYVKLANSL